MLTRMSSTKTYDKGTYASRAGLSLMALIALTAPAVAEVEQPTAPVSRAARIATTDLDARIELELPRPSRAFGRSLADVLTFGACCHEGAEPNALGFAERDSLYPNL